MKRSVRNSILTILCGAIAAGACACSTSQTYPVTVDGEKFRAGLYILEQQAAVSEAVGKLTAEQPDLDTSAENFDYFAQTVEGQKFGDWVNARALENCREYIAVNRLFDQYGLEVTADELKNINANVNQLWTQENSYAQYFYGVDIVGKYYEKYGIGEQSYKELQIEGLKRDKLFEHLYGEGGEKAATEDEIKASLQNDYLALNYFPFELKDADAKPYADRIAAGESYEAVYRDYAQALADKEAAESAAAAAEEAASAEDTDAEDAAAESTENTDNTAATTVEEAEKDSLIQIIKKSSGSPSESFIDQASAMNAGDVKVITVEAEADTRTYVVQRLDILAYPDKTESTVTTIRSELKQDEYNDMLKQTGAGYSLTTDSSINLYKPEKLMEK